MTPRMREVYDFVDAFIRQNGFSPSYEEIGEAVGVGSRSTIHRVIKALAERGHIRMLKGRSRSIEIVRPASPADQIEIACAHLTEIAATTSLHKAQECARDALRQIERARA